ncbi:28248_t:CDS:2, partial [Gigaspora margarita]
MSVQETNNGQNNNKTNYMMEPIAESSGSSLLRSTDARFLMTNENLVKQTYKQIRIREAKLEEMKDTTVPIYAKSETYAQDITQNVWSKAVNMNTTNPKEATVNMVSNIELPTSLSAFNSLIAEREPRDEPTLDNPYSEQYPEEDISTRSSDIVMEIVEKE